MRLKTKQVATPLLLEPMSKVANRPQGQSRLTLTHAAWMMAYLWASTSGGPDVGIYGSYRATLASDMSSLSTVPSVKIIQWKCLCWYKTTCYQNTTADTRDDMGVPTFNPSTQWQANLWWPFSCPNNKTFWERCQELVYAHGLGFYS